ncbi:MAG TPA: hypothetical protein GX700_16455 [Paracoccus sp.]|nr:hypothetical protein [Paracoccus sp. (in: a-proteobacteria)]
MRSPRHCATLPEARSFGQSLGIPLGANIGITFTGWMVMLPGVKITGAA